MRRYHHIGIPTTESKPGETHLNHLKLFVVSHQKSEFGVEWMRFEADAAVPDLVRRVAHVAFEVTDLSSELAGREILIPPNSPSDDERDAVHMVYSGWTADRYGRVRRLGRSSFVEELEARLIEDV